MLELELGFPLGRYFAASHEDPSRPEWPPHPSRVFSALVSAAYMSGEMSHADSRLALQMLEGLPPPSISCPEADLAPSPDRYVPINDLKSFQDPKKRNHPVRPLHVGRHFPAAFVRGEPIVRYLWASELEGHLVERLNRIAAAMTHVGTSHSQVVGNFGSGDDVHDPTWIPVSNDVEQFLRITSAGRLDELDAVHGERGGLLRRTLPARELLHGYARPGHRSEPPLPSRYRWFSWRVKEAAWGIDTPETFARAVRTAVLSLMADEAPAAIHGHDPQIPHAAYLPLADVGHPHGSGRIVAFALALPMLAAEEMQRVASALTQLRVVVLPDGQLARLEPVQLTAQLPASVRPATWCGPQSGARLWSTVTPVVLDRTPKKRTHDAVAAEVSRSLQFAGFPAPEQVEILHASDFAGAPRALDVPSRYPRYHARVRFSQPCRGPVIAGRGRHFGGGLFRPSPEEFAG